MKKNKKTIKMYKLKKSKNKTLKYYGGNSDKAANPIKEVNKLDGKKSSVWSTVSEKITSMTLPTLKYVEEKGLRLLGLQKIKKKVEPEKNVEETKEIDDKINEISDTTSELVSSAQENVSNIVNNVNSGSANVIENINNTLNSPEVSETISDAAEKTAEISTKLLENFNDNLSTPEIKAQTKEALDNVAEYSEIVVDSLDEPLNKGIDSLNKAGTKVTGALASGAVKVGTDLLGAIPGIGAIVDLGKMMNDAASTASTAMEAGKEATETISEIVKETSDNIDAKLDDKNKLEQDKLQQDKLQQDKLQQDKLNKESINVSKRINNSIKEFENPYKNKLKPAITQSGGKTKRKICKYKGKSKRVRFAI